MICLKLKIDYITIRVKCCNFLNLYGHYVLQYKSFSTILSLQKQQIEVRLAAIKSAYFLPSVYTPFHFSRTLPLSIHQLKCVTFQCYPLSEYRGKCRNISLVLDWSEEGYQRRPYAEQRQSRSQIYLQQERIRAKMI